MFLEESVQTRGYLSTDLVVDDLRLELNGDVSVGQLAVDELNSFDSALEESLGFLVDEAKGLERPGSLLTFCRTRSFQL